MLCSLRVLLQLQSPSPSLLPSGLKPFARSFFQKHRPVRAWTTPIVSLSTFFLTEQTRPALQCTNRQRASTAAARGPEAGAGAPSRLSLPPDAVLFYGEVTPWRWRCAPGPRWVRARARLRPSPSLSPPLCTAACSLASPRHQTRAHPTSPKRRAQCAHASMSRRDGVQCSQRNQGAKEIEGERSCFVFLPPAPW